MRSLLLAYLFALTVPVAAQPDGADASPFSANGTLGFGHAVSSGPSGGVYGFDFGADIRYQRHGVGFRTRVFTTFTVFGSADQVFSFDGIYSYRLWRGVLPGVGLSYVTENEVPNRVGVPVELTVRFLYPAEVGPYARAFAVLGGDRTFGGVALGFTY